MISPGKEEHLGSMARYIMILRRVIVGVVLVILAAVILGMSGFFISNIAAIIITGGGDRAQAVAEASTIVTDSILLVLIVGCLIMFIGFVIAWIEYLNYTYTIGEFDLVMKSGFMDRTETSIPYRQIQDVNIDRSLAQQLFGLSRLVMQTAGHEESSEREMTEVVLEPIKKDVAEEIRDMLQRKIGVQITQTEQAADKGTGSTDVPHA